MSAEMKSQLDRIESMLATLLRGEKPALDPKVFTDPRDWKGESQKDKPFSACPVEYLQQAGAMYDTFAGLAEKEGTLLSNGKSKADWNRQLAKAARDWARYNAAGPAREDFDFPGAL